MTSMLFVLTSLILVPLQLGISLFFLLRGHNQPGGGFIAGLVAALAYVMARLAGSFPLLTQRTGEGALGLIAAGWSCMVLSAAPGIFGAAAMEAWWGPELYIPLIGSIKIGSVLLFDTGVYLTVTGALVKVAHVAIVEESQR